MLPTPSKSPWFEQGSSFISLEDIMVGVQFRARRTAPMLRRLRAVLNLPDLCLQRFWLVPSSRYFLKLFLIVTGVGGALPNLLLNSCWTWTALCVSANLRTIKALWCGVNCTPTMMSSKLINEDPCSNHELLDGVGNIIKMFIHWSMWSMTRMSSLGTIVHNKLIMSIILTCWDAACLEVELLILN